MNALTEIFAAVSVNQNALTGGGSGVIQSGPNGTAAKLIARRKQPLLINNRPQKRVFCGLIDGLFAGCFSPLMLVSGGTGADALSHLFEQYCDWANNLHPSVFSFLLRSSLVLGLSTLFCGLAFRHGNRSVLLQSFIFLNSIFLAMVIPVEHWQLSHRVIKAWVVAICAFLTATMPAVLPLFVARELGSQQKIRRVTFGILLALFVGTLFCALSSWKS
jgi:hypothetical protein